MPRTTRADPAVKRTSVTRAYQRAIEFMARMPPPAEPPTALVQLVAHQFYTRPDYVRAAVRKYVAKRRHPAGGLPPLDPKYTTHAPTPTTPTPEPHAPGRPGA